MNNITDKFELIKKEDESVENLLNSDSNVI